MGCSTGAALYAPGKPTVYAIVNISRTNLSRVKLWGLDFNVSYTHDTAFGSIDASFAGNYQLSRKTQSVITLPFTDDLAAGTSRFNFVARAGADIGNFRAQATLYHNAGYALNPLPANAMQTSVGAFEVIDLFFKYDVPGEAAQGSVADAQYQQRLQRDPAGLAALTMALPTAAQGIGRPTTAMEQGLDEGTQPARSSLAPTSAMRSTSR